jgi:hypothetical protein
MVQNFPAGHYNYGLEGGLNSGNISVSDGNSNENSRLGIVAGIYWEFFRDDFIAFVPGAYIVGKGYRLESDSNQAVVLNYFQLRLIGRLPIIRSQSSKFYLDFGGSADLITQKGTQNTPSPAPLTHVGNFDSSVMGGLGFETDLTKSLKIAFNAKYHYGLINIYNTSSLTIDSTTVALPKVYNTGFFLTMALQFTTESEKVISTGERARDYINRKSPN